jgi:hypothetical protein
MFIHLLVPGLFNNVLNSSYIDATVSMLQASVPYVENGSDNIGQNQ